MKLYVLIWNLLVGITCSSLVAQSWNQKGNEIAAEGNYDSFGFSVDMSSDGNRIIASGPGNDGNGNGSGHARVYEWNGFSWNQMGSDLDGESAGDGLGWEISISGNGNRIALGSRLNDGLANDAGHVRVFEWNGANWVQVGADINGTVAEDWFGYSVSLDSLGNNLIVGVPQQDGAYDNIGAVKIFQWNGASWIQRGSEITGSFHYDGMGYDVDISNNGNTIILGTPYEDDNGGNSGQAAVYTWNGSNWILKGSKINGVGASEELGYKVCISGDGNTIAASSPNADGNGNNSGYARVYRWNGSNWIAMGSAFMGANIADNLGSSIALSYNGSKFALGEYGNGNPGLINVYEWNGASWINLGQTMIGTGGAAWAGYSCALSASGENLIYGGPISEISFVDAGRIWMYDICYNTQSTDTVTSCDSYTWINGATYTSSNNNATHTLINNKGCDSVVTLNLTIKQSSLHIDNQEACNNYTWIDGNTYTSSNNSATYTLTNSVGCDSVVSLNLTINQSYIITIDTTITQGESITVGSNTYDIEGNFVDTLNSSNNCDSIVTTNLTIEVLGNVLSTKNASLKMYPNPANGELSITSDKRIETIRIINIQGKVLAEYSAINQKSINVDVSDYSNGIYFIKTKVAGEAEQTSKLIKK